MPRTPNEAVHLDAQIAEKVGAYMEAHQCGLNAAHGPGRQLNVAYRVPVVKKVGEHIFDKGGVVL